MSTKTKEKPKTEAPLATSRRFKVHANMLMDVIRKQAGTLSKAILEGIMNSIDARAKECRITIDLNKVRIQDDGVGISAEQIEKVFEYFGQPHEAAENKIYGAFRMGRGQLFAFGRNVWRTSTSRMEIDVENKGLDYDLTSGLANVPGCDIEIELYRPLTSLDRLNLCEEMGRLAKYSQVPVYVNGSLISVDPATEEWDQVLPEAYVKLNSKSSLDVYNLGVHTMSIGSYVYGTGGTVVSRKQLQVNFARNDVMSTCPVWSVIRPYLETRVEKDLTSKKIAFNDGERERMAKLFITKGRNLENAAKLPLFTTVNGRHYSAEYVVRQIRKCSGRYSVGKMGSAVADAAMSSETAFVFSNTTLERFKVSTASALLEYIGKVVYVGREDFTYSSIEDLERMLEARHDMIDSSDWSVSEKIWMDLLSRTFIILTHELDEDRKLFVGDSLGVEGWTDGHASIFLCRKLLEESGFCVEGYTKVGMVLCHELAHTDNDIGSHGHDVEFYEKFHDLVHQQLPKFVDACVSRAPVVVASHSSKLARTAYKTVEHVENFIGNLKELVETADTWIEKNQVTLTALRKSEEETA